MLVLLQYRFKNTYNFLNKFRGNAPRVKFSAPTYPYVYRKLLQHFEPILMEKVAIASDLSKSYTLRILISL